MRTLPNGVKIFNATPHPVTFWREDWDDVYVVEPDLTVSAEILEEVVQERDGITLVSTRFCPTEGGRLIVNCALSVDCVVVGSIIAAQAYPGKVFAMVPCAGYERVPPAEKRMQPDKFTLF